MPRRAFTLIEILVCIAIIALLIAIILPSLAGAREASRAARCLSNQRQIGLALVLYSEAFREVIPRESGFSEGAKDPPNPPWAYVLRPFLDPRATSDGPTTDPDGFPGDEKSDLYTLAPFYKDPSRRPDRHEIHYVNNGLSFSAPGKLNSVAKKPTPMNRYARPYHTLYLSCFTDDAKGTHANGWYTPNQTNFGLAVVYDMHHASNVTGGVENPQMSQRIAPNRHGNGANGLFLDGHAERLPAAELVTIERWDDGDYRPNGVK